MANRQLAIALSMFALPSICSAKHDIEFIQEHLPEVAMDNRYATLPIWDLGRESSAGNSYQLQAALSRSGSGNLEISGPLTSIGVQRSIGADTQLGVFAFYDALELTASRDSRPLQTLFAPNTPIERPVDAEFSNLDGTATDFGAGFAWSRQLQAGFLGRHTWVAGALWQRVQLQDYRLDYRLTAGPQQGMQGQIDFDARYDHVVPFFGLETPRTWGAWILTPHALLAYPIPRHGIEGHITGPGFDIGGNTENAGNGKHFGDPSLTLGLNFTYAPAHLSIDVGALLTQGLLEKRIHSGIEHNVLLSFSWVL
jgi:hypothetical protein